MLYSSIKDSVKKRCDVKCKHCALLIKSGCKKKEREKKNLIAACQCEAFVEHDTIQQFMVKTTSVKYIIVEHTSK